MQRERERERERKKDLNKAAIHLLIETKWVSFCLMKSKNWEIKKEKEGGRERMQMQEEDED